MNFQHIPQAMMTTFTLWHFIHNTEARLNDYVNKKFRRKLKLLSRLRKLEQHEVSVAVSNLINDYRQLTHIEISQIAEFVGKEKVAFKVDERILNGLLSDGSLKSKMVQNLLLQSNLNKDIHDRILLKITRNSLKD